MCYEHWKKDFPEHFQLNLKPRSNYISTIESIMVNNKLRVIPFRRKTWPPLNATSRRRILVNFSEFKIIIIQVWWQHNWSFQSLPDDKFPNSGRKDCFFEHRTKRSIIGIKRTKKIAKQNNNNKNYKIWKISIKKKCNAVATSMSNK